MACKWYINKTFLKQMQQKKENMGSSATQIYFRSQVPPLLHNYNKLPNAKLQISRYLLLESDLGGLW